MSDLTSHSDESFATCGIEISPEDVANLSASRSEEADWIIWNAFGLVGANEFWDYFDRYQYIQDLADAAENIQDNQK